MAGSKMPGSRLALPLSLLAFCAIHREAGAGTEGDPQGPIFRKPSFSQMERVVVVSKKPESILEAPGTVYVITDEDIERFGWRDMREILWSIPNMDQVWQLYWANGGQRGFTGNSAGTLLLIDGREVQNLLADEAMMQNFPAHRIKRVEVLQGPGSALYGSNASEGVINIVTKLADPLQEDASQVSFLAGETDSRGAYAFSRKNGANTSLGVSGSYFTSLQNWGPLRDFIADDGRFSRRPSVDSVRDKESDKVVFPVESETFDFFASSPHVYAGANYFREENTEGMEMVRVRLGERTGYRLAFHGFAGAKYEREALQGFAEYRYSRERDNFLGADQTVIPLPNRVFRPERHRLKAQGTYRFPNQTIVFGYDGIIHETRFYEDTALVGGLTYPAIPSRIFRTYLNSVFAENTIFLLDGRLKINAGLRVEKQKGMDPQVIPRLGMVLQAWRGAAVKLLYGHGVRAPGPFELNNARSAGIAASEVPSRKTDDFEVNWVQESGWGDWRFVNSMSGYHMVANENFQQVLVQDTFRLVLDEDKTVDGVEDLLRITWREKHGGFLGGRWIDPSRTEVAGEKIVADVPIVRGKAGLYSRLLPWILIGVFIDASGEVKTDANSPDGNSVEVLTIPGWVNTNLNLRLGDFDLGKPGGARLGFSTFIENVFDETYYHPNHRGTSPIQYMQAPRNMRFTADMKF